MKKIKNSKKFDFILLAIIVVVLVCYFGRGIYNNEPHLKKQMQKESKAIEVVTKKLS